MSVKFSEMSSGLVRFFGHNCFCSQRIFTAKSALAQMLVSLVIVLVLSSPIMANEAKDFRPKNWAQPISLEGVHNLHKISDKLYRSAQPTSQGMKNLKDMGIQTIVNLRSYHSDREAIGNTGLGYEHLYMKAWHPERKEAIRFLQIVTNPKRSPVLFHCLHGADRTGTMCAVYRIAVQGWTKQEAILELRDGGYNYHSVFLNLTQWIEGLDVESIKKEAGIVGSP